MLLGDGGGVWGEGGIGGGREGIGGMNYGGDSVDGPAKLSPPSPLPPTTDPLALVFFFFFFLPDASRQIVFVRLSAAGDSCWSGGGD